MKLIDELNKRLNQWQAYAEYLKSRCGDHKLFVKGFVEFTGETKAAYPLRALTYKPVAVGTCPLCKEETADLQFCYVGDNIDDQLMCVRCAIEVIRSVNEKSKS